MRWCYLTVLIWIGVGHPDGGWTAMEAGAAPAWPTLHGNLQRTGYYPSFPKGPLRLAWRRELHAELSGPRAEIIVGSGLAYLGTYAGKLHAWDAVTGEERWVLEVGAPIGHSPSWQDGILYCGALDGKLRAIDVPRGVARWEYEAEAGIWSSPAVVGDAVYVGDRAGVFHAVRTADGRARWRFQTGDRILNSPAVTGDGKRVLFASEDMHLYCLDTGTGELVWRSRKLQGLSVRDYFPVLAGGLAFVTTNPVRDFHAVLDGHQSLLISWSGFQGGDPRYVPGGAEEVAREQERIVAHLKEHPEDQTFYAFRLEDGREPWVAPIFYAGGMHNPMTPPCYNPRTGELFVTVRSAYGVWDGGGEVRPLTGFGRMDLATGRVELLAHGYRSREEGRPAGARDAPWMVFNYIGDETQALSCSPGRLYGSHQGYLGMMDLETGQLSRLFGKRDTYGGFYGPGTHGWEGQGGPERAAAAGEPFGIVNEWHGPARAIATVAGGRVYYHVGAQVLCYEEVSP